MELDARRIGMMRGGLTPDELASELKRACDSICLKALKKEPSERYDSALAMAKDVGAALDGRKPPIASSADPFAKASRMLSRYPFVFAGAVALVSVSSGGLTLPQALSVSTATVAASAAKLARTNSAALAELTGPVRLELVSKVELRPALRTLDAVAQQAQPDPPVKTWPERLRQLIFDAWNLFEYLRGTIK